MKKSIFVILFLLTLAPLSWAQEKPAGSLKDLALAELYEYGEALYDRHDYREAKNVFNHILELNPQYTPAMAYVSKMEGKVFSQTETVACCAVLPVSSMPSAMVAEPAVRHTFVASVKPMPTAVPEYSNDPNADLKQEIASEDIKIKTLHEELTQMHTSTETSVQ